MQKTDNKAVIVTGALGGIGSGLCVELTRAGYHVIGIDCKTGTDVNGYQIVAYDLEKLLSSDAERQQFRSLISNAQKGHKLFAIVNNAAVQITGLIENFTVEETRRTMDINSIVPFLLTKLFLDDLKQSKGKVINIGSVHAETTKKGFVVYAMSKSALAGLTRGLALELGEFGICVNCIQPGAVDTPMLREGFIDKPEALIKLGDFQPLKRIGNPSDISGLVQYLLSDNSRYITGATINIDGGISTCLHDP